MSLDLDPFELPCGRRGHFVKKGGVVAEASPYQGSSKENAMKFALSCLNYLPECKEPIPITALLFGSDEEVLAKAECIKDYKFAKIKLRDLKRPIETVQKVSAILGPNVTLRIDANQNLPDGFAEAFPKGAFDYIEEPGPRGALHHPVAYDESLRAGFLPPKGSIVIVKPTMLGPFDTKNYRCIYSSSFESPVGLYWIARLAYANRCHKEGVGIDTESALSLKTTYFDKPYVQLGFTPPRPEDFLSSE